MRAMYGFVPLTLIAALSSPTLLAAAPLSAEAIPVPPSAVYDRAAEAEHDQLLEVPTSAGSGPLGDELQGLGLLSRYKKVYITNTNARADEVARFYRERLGGVQADGGPGYINTGTDLQKIKPGAAGPVEYALCKSATGYREHIWRWIVRVDADEVRCLTVIVKDMSAAYDGQTFRFRAYLVILGKTYSRRAPRVVVTERDLGLPIYPGALLDVNESVRLDLGGSIHIEYVFVSTDHQAKIVAYYEKALGRKAASSDGGKMVFLLPDREYLVINPTGADGRTTIVVIKNKSA